MSGQRGFILLESIFSLVLVIALTLGILQILTTAVVNYERGQKLLEGVQIAGRECQGVSVPDARYRVVKQSSQISDINIKRTIISIYDQQQCILNVVVYE